MKRFKFLSFLVLLAYSVGAFALAPSNEYLSDKASEVKSGLAKARSVADSIRIMYDVFDLSPKDDKAEAAWQLLDISRRHKDSEVMSDMVRQLSVLELRDSVALLRLLEIAGEIPDSTQRRMAEIFVNVERATNEASFLPPEKLQKALMRYVKEDMTPKYDKYQDLLDLYRVVVFLRNVSTQGNIYMEYITRLEDLITQMPPEMHYLKSLFYTSAAVFYTNKGMAAKGVECDRMLLQIIKNLEQHYKKKGRKYKNFDRNKYICYRRMLSNHKALDLDEVKELYAKCAMLAEKDEDIKQSFANDPRPTAYRLIAEKDYAEAIPYLRRSLENVKELNVKERVVRRLMAAADSAGDHDTKLFALEEYNKIFNDKRQSDIETSMLELQMRYNVNKMRAATEEVAIAKKDMEIVTSQKIISVTLISLFLLAIGLMFLYRNHFKLLKRTRALEEEKRSLEKTIKELLDGDVPEGSVDLRSLTEKNQK